MPVSYVCRSYLVPSGLEEDLVADLWQQGTLGVQSFPLTGEDAGGRVRIEAWFADRDARGLTEIETRWRERGAEPVEVVSVPETDWLEPWRRSAKPIEVGRRLLLDPREPDASRDEAEPGGGRLRLRLPARQAFGTGSHETTRLALGLLEEVCAAAARGPRRVLDVGTGTGVLSFASLVFGAARAVSYDADPIAVFAARANARLNRLALGSSAPLLFAGTSEALAVGDDPRLRFDLVVINVLLERIVGELAGLAQRVARGGSLIQAGMLVGEGEDVCRRLASLGFQPVAASREGDWVGFRFERRSEEAV